MGFLWGPYGVSMGFLWGPTGVCVVQCVTTLLMLVSGDTYTLINYVGVVNHAWYGITVLGLLLLRRQKPHLPRPIRVRRPIAAP